MAGMRRVELGKTGVEVTEFFFGAGAIGGIGSAASTRGRGLSPAQGRSRLDEAFDLGIRVVDTANSYAGGESERVVGEWLADSPDAADMLIETKVGGPAEPAQGGVDLSTAHIRRQLLASLERLGRVDLYLSHAPDASTPIEETLTAFAEAREKGSIRAYGCSNVEVSELEALLSAADRLGLPRPGWVQNRFSLVAREDERDLLPLVAAEGLGYTPFSPLAGGILSGRYLGGASPQSGSRLDVAGVMYRDAFTPEVLERVGRLADLAHARGVSVSGLALAWLRRHPVVTAPIVSPSSAAQWDAVREALAMAPDAALFEEVGALFPVP